MLLWWLGIIGVIIGTFVAGFIRTSQYAIHALKGVLNISTTHLLRSYGVYFVTFLGLVFGFSFIDMNADANFLSWILYSLAVSVVCFVVVVIVSLINNKAQINYLKKRLFKKK